MFAKDPADDIRKRAWQKSLLHTPHPQKSRIAVMSFEFAAENLVMGLEGCGRTTRSIKVELVFLL